MENDIIAKDIIKIKESIKVDGVTEFSFVFPDNVLITHIKLRN